MKFLKIISLVVLLFSTWALALDKDGTFARVVEHIDGSKSMFEKSADGQLVIQRKFNSGGLLEQVIEYKLNLDEQPLSCKVHAPDGKLIYRIRYGYDMNTGQLKEEQIIDYKNPIIHPKTGENVPAFRYKYTYDAFGKAVAPEVIAFNPDGINRGYLKRFIWDSDPYAKSTK